MVFSMFFCRLINIDMASDQAIAMPNMQPGRECIFDIMGVFVRVSCPTETDRPRQTDALRAGGFEREALSIFTLHFKVEV